MRKLALASAAALATVSVPAFAADLLGSTATATLFYPDLNTVFPGGGPVSATVAAADTEFDGNNIVGPGTIDIGATTITFFSNYSGAYGSDGDFNGYRIDFSNAPIQLTSIALNPSSTFAPLEFYRDGNSILFNVNGQSPNNGIAVFDIGVAAAVPEPATWAMMIVGVGFVGGAMRRRTVTSLSGERKLQAA